MPQPPSFLHLIHVATHQISHMIATGGEALDPDGHTVREAMLVALRAAAIADTQPMGQATAWDAYAAAIGQAIADLQAELPEAAVLPDSIRPTAEAGLRTATTELVTVLATLCAASAAHGTASGWRRLVWARVAHTLDAAAAELT
jgi:hypothetical protein